MHHNHRMLVGALAVAITTLGACAKKDGTNADTLVSYGSVRTDTMAAHDSMGPNASHNGWTDAQIVAYASAASDGEISEGKLAQQKATNAGVKAFARQLVVDHLAMFNEGRAFAKKHNIVPDTTKDDITGLMKDGRDHVKDFTEKKAGADWDKAYLDEAIEGHQKVLGKLQDAAKGTTDTALRQMLVKASGKVQEHLTKAQALKEKYPTS